MHASLSAMLLVGTGGFVGSVLRYAVSGAVQSRLPLSTFPYGTLGVNALGCLAIGALAGLADSRQLLGPQARLLLLIGLLGGFTTFSTFAWETLAMARDGEYLRAAANVAASNALGLLCAWLGYSVAGSS